MILAFLVGLTANTLAPLRPATVALARVGWCAALPDAPPQLVNTREARFWQLPSDDYGPGKDHGPWSDFHPWKVTAASTAIETGQLAALKVIIAPDSPISVSGAKVSLDDHPGQTGDSVIHFTAAMQNRTDDKIGAVILILLNRKRKQDIYLDCELGLIEPHQEFELSPGSDFYFQLLPGQIVSDLELHVAGVVFGDGRKWVSWPGALVTRSVVDSPPAPLDHPSVLLSESAASASDAKEVVHVRVLIGPTGRAGAFVVTRTAQRVDVGLMKELDRLRFRPAIRNGRAVECWTDLALIASG
ncbi:MAG: hypothetical protein ACREDR_16940 [Blastocatellia bacterium]